MAEIVNSREAAYARALSQAALARQKAEAERRCLACWAPHGEPHSPVCPNRPDDEEPLQPEQEESLF